MEKFFIKSLEDLAFEASYKMIVSTLLLCHDHRPVGQEIPWLCSSLLTSFEPFSTSENICSLVRSQLDYHLVGTMSDTIRQKLARKFYKSLYENFEDKNITFIDNWVFLDCVLDKNLKDLEIHAAFPDSKLCPKVVPIVVKWCPDLEKLLINFGLRDVSTSNEEWLEKSKSVILPLSSLQNLKDLTLKETIDWELISMLPLLGRSCPLLSHLSVSSYTLYVGILLALILGEAYFDVMSNNTLLPPFLLEDDKLECLVIPPERLSPICFTLVDFRLESTDQACSINASEISFALRHLPLIERMGKEMPVSLAIKIIYYSPTFKVQEEWRKAFKEPAANQPIFFKNLGVNFTGHLSLTRVDFVNVRYEEMLRAVGAMCPSLKEVVFCNETFHSQHDYARGSPLILENTLPPEKLESILEEWPQQLTFIGFNDVSSSYMTPILKVFGQQLHRLEVKSCLDIKLTDLALCSHLESLKIRESSLDPREWISTNDAPAFLPHLTTFESDSCLGPSSRLFEEKSTLVSLVLHCSHVGVNDECRRSNRFLNSMEEGQLEFIGWIAELWSHLETLAIHQFAGLSMKTMSGIIPQLRKLREVTLPERISSYDLPLFLSIRNELISRKPPVEISFAEFDDSAICPVLEQY